MYLTAYLFRVACATAACKEQQQQPTELILTPIALPTDSSCTDSCKGAKPRVSTNQTA